jgi:adenine-specific DNA-methyltransferase
MATGEEKSTWANASSLPLIDNSMEISLTYANKKSESDILSRLAASLQTIWQPQTPTLNKLIYGDNLDVLTTFMKDSTIHGQIRLIYIDPPFATNKVFKSRSRRDAYTDLLFGATYLEFMRERLIFLRELLAENGSIYVHLDGNMIFHVKLLMDEIFGKQNFRNFITRRKCNPKNYTRNQYGNISDYLLFYTKSSEYVWNRPYQAWTSDRANEEYQYTEQETGRRYKKVPLHAPGERNGLTGQAWRGMLPPRGKHWQYTPKILDEMDARGEIYWSASGNPRRKIYLDVSAGIPIQDVWLDVKDAHNQNINITGYPTEKPMALLERIIQASSNPNDLVLDCFVGSGTTLSVASEMERNWIGIDNSKEAILTTLKRFLGGLSPMGDFVNRESQLVPQPQQLSMFQSHSIINKFELLALRNEGEDLHDILQFWTEKLSE